MPNLLVKDGFRIFIYSADGIEPKHVHVEYQGGMAKFWLTSPIQLASSYNLKAKDLKKAKLLVQNNVDFLRKKWDEYFTRSK